MLSRPNLGLPLKLILLLLICTILVLVFQTPHLIGLGSRQHEPLYMYESFSSHLHRVFNTTHHKSHPQPSIVVPLNPRVDLVVSSISSSNTSWTAKTHLPHNWQSKIYVSDDPSAEYNVPANKGHEAMTYLTYIIDHYDSLPDYTIFSHADRFQWHNDDPDYDGLAVLRRLRLSHLQLQGYVNLRCDWTVGCPTGFSPSRTEIEQKDSGLGPFRRAFQELLPNERVPSDVSHNCCAQFGATKAAIKSRSRDEYMHMRDWLVNTEYADYTTGRVFEYVWHIVLGKPAEYCPNAAECYCKLYGLCELKCWKGSCRGRYKHPGGNEPTLPQGWPYVDLQGRPRNWIEDKV